MKLNKVFQTFAKVALLAMFIMSICVVVYFLAFIVACKIDNTFAASMIGFGSESSLAQGLSLIVLIIFTIVAFLPGSAILLGFSIAGQILFKKMIRTNKKSVGFVVVGILQSLVFGVVVAFLMTATNAVFKIIGAVVAVCAVIVFAFAIYVATRKQVVESVEVISEK